MAKVNGPTTLSLIIYELSFRHTKMTGVNSEFAYNSRFHSSTGMSPFVVDLGYNPRSVDDLVLPTQRGHSQSSLRFLDKQQVILQQCQDELETAQATMKYFRDRNRPTYQLEPGDQDLLDTINPDLLHVGV
ncbi:Retrotransposon protein [Phytophthora megakarya]|uniref:Retrotransposon protein n=1 Tax=Phytophthora megakarya TaxID=4795 RepID=A0A225WAM5_9STRA|nr:Retrotransposon protein [Phytophthora megakarya]